MSSSSTASAPVTTTGHTYLKTDYLQPSFSSSSTSNPYDSSQSPLALLAQTCSSIGKDCPSPPSLSSTSSSSSSSSSTSTTTATSISNPTPPIITSLVSKPSSNPSSICNSDKSSLLSSKRTLSSQVNSSNSHRKSTVPLKSPTINKSSSFIDPSSSPLLSNPFPPLYDPTATAAALLLRSSLAYLAVQQQQQQQQPHHPYSTPCTVPGCLQCETVRHILAASALTNQASLYPCHWYSCNRRFSSNEDLVEHIQHHHRSSKLPTNPPRFHPYLKPSTMINNNDQLPFFYPHLSLSPMTGSTRRMNNNTDNNN